MDPVFEPLTIEEMVNEYRKLKEKKSSLEKTLQDVVYKLGHWSQLLLKRMLREGQTSTRTKDGATVYLRFDMSCNKMGGANGSVLVTALRSHGLDHLVSFSPQAMKSYIKEKMIDKYGEGWESIPNIDPREVLPEDVRDMFNVFTDLKAIVKGLGTIEEVNCDDKEE
jgi:hypothetical protein